MNVVKMKLYALLMIVLNACSSESLAWDGNIDTSYRRDVIEEVCNHLTDYYVFPDRADKVCAVLESALTSGEFDDMDRLQPFVMAINDRLLNTLNDKHVSVTIKAPKEDKRGDSEMPDWMRGKLEERYYYRRYAANFKAVTKLDSGNIGYLDLRGFYGLDYGKDFADGAMNRLATADAVIIDLRNNSGGRGGTSDYMLSYFFEDQVVASKSRKRSGDQFTERVNMSAPKVGGKKLIDVPVFLLTSAKTFSAAEGFAYALQAYDRVTIIGETTRGGANPGDIISINEELEIFVPDVSVTHPLTNGSWEGLGVKPDIEVPSDSAFEEAYNRAKVASKEYRASAEQRAEASILALDKVVKSYSADQGESILSAFLRCKADDIIFERWEITSWGFRYKSETGGMPTALALFETATILYPSSSIANEHYADALADNKEWASALDQYGKAIALAKEDGAANLNELQEKADKVKSRL